MRTLVFSIPFLSLAAACSQADSDQMYRRGNDSMMVCANGGFTVTLATAVLEGRIGDEDDGGLRGATGETGALAFTSYALQADGRWSSPELGAGWERAQLDEVGLDQARVQCSNLESRAWWPSTHALPKDTAFRRPSTYYPSLDACLEAHANGTDWHPCYDTIAFCRDGKLGMTRADVGAAGTYRASAGMLEVDPMTFPSFTAMYAFDRSLHIIDGNGVNEIWTQTEMTELEPSIRCD